MTQALVYEFSKKYFQPDTRQGYSKYKNTFENEKAEFRKINTSKKHFGKVWLFLRLLLKMSSTSLCNKMSGPMETEGMIERYVDEK